MSSVKQNPGKTPTENPATQELASVHTMGFTELLSHFGISLAISTYQAGKLILARADGKQTNTHFHAFDKPMGMAVSADRLTLGTTAQIQDFRNVPAAAARLKPEGRHDACYLSRGTHITGDIDIHEMAWVDEELWFINTRFSCLCTLDAAHSFVPRWRPPFISAYDMRDRCHLNGLAVRDGKPRYITALGATDETNGWRANKASGGILMDISNNEFLLEGLSMPHSPRWHKNRLWFLESGRGSLSYLDPVTGKAETLAELPGFTRGLDFIGDYALIGLSQVRETAVFAGLPLTQSQPVRHCGVWVVDIRTGESKAFLRFEKGVQEIFTVAILPWRFPELVGDDLALLSSTYTLPEAAMKETVQPSADWTFAETHFEQGNQLYNAGKVEESLSEYRKCLDMQADYLPARYNLGIALGNLKQYREAIVELNKVLTAEAGHSEALNSLGFSHSQLREDLQAAEYLRRAIEIRPDYTQAYFNLGMVLLRLGEYKDGWKACELSRAANTFDAGDAPRWDGTAVQGTLLIHIEQGSRDVFQFARFLEIAKSRCDKLLLVCSQNLLRLFANIPCVDVAHSLNDSSALEYQAHIPLLSLPQVFNIQANTITSKVPYLQASDTNKLAKNPTGILRVAILWADQSTPNNNPEWLADREVFLPLLEVQGIEFFSLLMGENNTDLKAHSQITDLGSQVSDYADCAGLLTQMDLVISADNALAHLAGALNIPVWLALDYAADWRYQRDSEDCLWYPNMRQFWQTSEREWQAVFAQIAAALEVWRDAQK